jgi:hypothetical protein
VLEKKILNLILKFILKIKKKIPELSEDKEDDSVINFLIQSIGILVGVGKNNFKFVNILFRINEFKLKGVMLLIALFEEQIKNSIKKKK